MQHLVCNVEFPDYPLSEGKLGQDGCSRFAVVSVGVRIGPYIGASTCRAKIYNEHLSFERRDCMTSRMWNCGRPANVSEEMSLN